MEIQKESNKKIIKEIFSLIGIIAFILILDIILYPIAHLMIFKI